MASNKKKDKAIGVFSIISIILCICALCLGFLKSQSEELYFALEYAKKVEVASIEDITALGDTVHNDEIVLTEDLYINDNGFRIGTSERPYSGTFDGKGHTVYVNYNSVNQNTSIFGCIAAAGVVKNTNFVFGSLSVNGNNFGGIAKVNYGTIQDCNINCSEILIDNNKGIYSPCVTINNGTISNIIVDCTFSNTKVNDDETSILFGGVCAYNYGIVKNCISSPSFRSIACTDEFKILTGEKTNVGVGAICAVNTNGASTTNSIAVLKKGVYTSDKSSGLKVVESFESIVDRNTIFFELDFNNSVWEIQGGKLVLIED